jgi:hypothetical protein
MNIINPTWIKNIRANQVMLITVQLVTVAIPRELLKIRFMRQIFACLLFFVFYLELTGQPVIEDITGQVSYVSTQNIYVKFKSTAGILKGDTLYTQKNGEILPVLIVKDLSSSSCICTTLTPMNFSVADPIIARILLATIKEDEEDVKPAIKELTIPAASSEPSVNKPFGALNQNIRGSISLNSYSDISNTIAGNAQRFRYTISLNASNIADSKFSVETYISFKHKVGEWQEVQDDVFNALKIYNLAVRYDINKSTQISLGRRINPRISSIGAMDGLQFEKSFNHFAVGGLAGYRPDFTNYGFNPDLFQYGAFGAYNTKNSSGYTETSLAFMQQMNNWKTDRRFLYFQHSNTLVKNINLFTTLEADLYQMVKDSLNNETPQNKFSLTGFYMSLTYRPVGNLSLSGSYDARKNIMYYETYKTFVDRILEEELRQGFRVQASYRITRDLTLGLQSGYRFLKSDPYPSRNLYGYLTYNQIPGVKLSATLSATCLESNFMNGNILGLTISRDFFNGKVQTGLGYRYVDYKLTENQLMVPQNIGEMNLSWQIAKKMSFAFYYEGTFEELYKYNRFYLQLRKRF